VDKHEIIAFFDGAAPEWDSHLIVDEKKIACILDAAGDLHGRTVLDAACGTGVLFPYYQQRGAARVIGVDISSEMTRIAAEKGWDSSVEILCGDMETMQVVRPCDCGVIYNAFPHFMEPEKLAAALWRWIKPDGRLVVAHSMSLEELQRHHAVRAKQVSRTMLTTQEMNDLLSPWFVVDTMISDEEKYIVAGVRRESPGSRQADL